MSTQTFFPLKCGLNFSVWIPKNRVWEGGDGNFTAEKRGRHQAFQVNVICDKSCWDHVSLIWYDKGILPPVVFLPQAYNLRVTMSQTSDKPKDILEKCPDSSSQNCQGHEKQGKAEKLSQTRED